jgi:hypothetical protein
MKRKNVIFLLLLFIAIATLFNACIKLLSGYWEYEFANESGYYITITLNQEYTSSKAGEPHSSTIYLYSGSSETVYVKDDSVDFSWTASSVSNNRYIYTVADGSKVTFKAR